MNLLHRPRRLRRNAKIRNLVAETSLRYSSLIQPYFVTDGDGVREVITGLPGIYRESVDCLMASIKEDIDIGIKNIMLFGVTDRKSPQARYAYDTDNPVIRAVHELKQKYGETIFVSTDVCLCAYTDTGHCGITFEGRIDNDRSVEVLGNMAVELARAGCDCVAPSDMMDGRVGAIRRALDEHGFQDTIIMAYTAKYASAYYGPFREAANSAPAKGDRKSYQMDFRNVREALTELQLDEAEGADIVMVKPALAYLDVIAAFRRHTDCPVAAYNVSGEYAAVKLLAQAGYGEEARLVIENLTAIQRAGADIILTYHLRDILREGWHHDTV